MVVGDAVPDRALLQQVESIRVTYPRWQRILDEIARCHTLGPVAAEPPCLLLVGPTGAGKSTLVGAYARAYPPALTETGATYPVLRATMKLLRRHYGYVPLSWVFGYTAYRIDRRDQFFEALQPSPWKFLAALPVGLWWNRRRPWRFAAEWIAAPFRYLRRRRTR